MNAEGHFHKECAGQHNHSLKPVVSEVRKGPDTHSKRSGSAMRARRRKTDQFLCNEYVQVLHLGPLLSNQNVPWRIQYARICCRARIGPSREICARLGRSKARPVEACLQAMQVAA